MHKLLLLIFFTSIYHFGFSQGERMEIEGAIILSNNEDTIPSPGTIRWTGQDFEGFDGTQWKSLTRSSSTDTLFHADFAGNNSWGHWYYDATGDKAHANLGTIVDPDKQLTIAAQGTGTGTGVFRRVNVDGFNVKWFGAMGDGVTDDTGAFVKTSKALQLNVTTVKKIYFPAGTYIVSHQGFTDFSPAKPYGNSIFDLETQKNVIIKGDKAVIKTAIPHNINTYGGLLVFRLSNVNHLEISGLSFDMKFTGYKNSSAFYPLCGAIRIYNDNYTSGSLAENLSGDIILSDINLKLFHPLGCYGITDAGNAYNGDPNNGFKIFGVFVQGTHHATNYENNSRNLIIKDCIVKDGHNGYGFWVWANYNATFQNLTAESWVCKGSKATSGQIVNAGVPFIRHHAFKTTNTKILNCTFRAKPSSERVLAGYEGGAVFIGLYQNLVGVDIDNGMYTCSNNHVIMGNGDAASALSDYGIVSYAFGQQLFSNNLFDGHKNDDTNTHSGACIAYNSSANGNKGSAQISVLNNQFGKWLKYTNNIVIGNQNSISVTDRRVKQVLIKGNVSNGRKQYFFNGLTGSGSYHGFEQLIITDNIINGTSSQYLPSSSNSRAINIGGSETTDMITITNNLISDAYYGIIATLGANSPNRNEANNTMLRVTIPRSGI